MQEHGLLVLFKINKNFRENIKIVLLLFLIGGITGIAINLIGISI